jgi:hypothetical protein
MFPSEVEKVSTIPVTVVAECRIKGEFLRTPHTRLCMFVLVLVLDAPKPGLEERRIWKGESAFQ